MKISQTKTKVIFTDMLTAAQLENVEISAAATKCKCVSTNNLCTQTVTGTEKNIKEFIKTYNNQ
jgi:hypothetical protein